jgi:hypothetical protein
VTELGLDLEGIWCQARRAEAGLWRDAPPATPRESLHVGAQVPMGYQLLHLAYAEAVVAAALRLLRPDEVRVPPAWNARATQRLNISFSQLQLLVRSGARRHNVRCKRHWSAALLHRSTWSLAGLAQLLLLGLVAAYDLVRIASWLTALVRRGGGFLRHGRSPRPAPEHSTDRGPIIVANVDTDLPRQFDVQHLPGGLLGDCLAWLDVERRQRLFHLLWWQNAWRQLPLKDYLAGGAARRSGRVPGAEPGGFPTLVTPLVLRHSRTWFCSAWSACPARMRALPLMIALGAPGMAAARLRNFRWVVDAAKRFALACDAFRTLRPALFIAGDTLDVHRYFALAARHCGVRSLATAHAIGMWYEPATLVDKYALSDVHCLFSRQSAAFGADDLLWASPRRVVYHDSLPPAAAPDRRPDARTGRRVLVLVTLYGYSPSGFTNSMFVRAAEYVEALHRLIEGLARRGAAYEVILKSHPLARPHEAALYDEVQRRYPEVVKRHWREPLPSDEPVPADLVLLFNSTSTLVFSVIRQGVPLVAYWGELTPLAHRISPIRQLLGSDRVDSVCDLVAEILNDVDGPTARDARARARAVHDCFIQPPKGGLADAIELALGAGPRAGATSGTLKPADGRMEVPCSASSPETR